jgi:indole-3-glycerol phosphate synthase
MRKPDILKKIFLKKEEEVRALCLAPGLEIMRKHAFQVDTESFRLYKALSKPGLSLVAEIKKASPSKGLIRDEFDPPIIAKEFENKNASAISVLTEVDFFLGRPEYIKQVRSVSSLPILRKDFIFDPIQIYEAKVLGADAILLIQAMLEPAQCQELLNVAAEIGLDVVLEIHNEQGFEEIKGLDNVNIIGINNRDLHTFEVDITRISKVFDLVKKAKPDVKVIAESGYTKPSELEFIEELGVDAVLIGEGLAKNKGLIEFFCPL